MKVVVSVAVEAVEVAAAVAPVLPGICVAPWVVALAVLLPLAVAATELLVATVVDLVALPTEVVMASAVATATPRALLVLPLGGKSAVVVSDEAVRSDWLSISFSSFFPFLPFIDGYDQNES